MPFVDTDLRGLVPTHVAFELERTWIDDVEAAATAIGAGDDTVARDALARWWTRRDRHHGTATATLEREGRDELASWLAIEPLLAELATSAPRTVRLAALARLRHHAHTLARLVELGAPETIIATERTAAAEQLQLLDPASTWPGDPRPELATVAVDGGDRLNACDWLAWMIAAGRGASPYFGIGSKLASTPAGQRLAERDRHPVPAVPGGPGLTGTAYLAYPDDGLWCAPLIALPRRLELAGTPRRTVVVDGSGGPLTYARAGDTPGSDVDRALARVAGRLAANRVLISFVWLDDDHGEPAPWD